jgi:hypothetical protein
MGESKHSDTKSTEDVHRGRYGIENVTENDSVEILLIAFMSRLLLYQNARMRQCPSQLRVTVY